MQVIEFRLHSDKQPGECINSHRLGRLLDMLDRPAHTAHQHQAACKPLRECVAHLAQRTTTDLQGSSQHSIAHDTTHCEGRVTSHD